jgi:hypothetical protein
MKESIVSLSFSIIAMFNLHSQTWVQRGGDIYGQGVGDNAGSAVELSVSGNTVIVGSPSNDAAGVDAGQARVFEWNGSAWIQKGLDLNGLTAGDQFGKSVAINTSGDIIAIGAPYFDGSGNDIGMVRAYQWNGSAWIQMGTDLLGGAGGVQNYFGLSIDLTDNSRLAVGEPAGGLGQQGAVSVFEWNGFSWTQMGSAITGDMTYDLFGQSVSMKNYDNYIVIGAPRNDFMGAEAGEVKVYFWDGNNWVQYGSSIYGSSAGDQFGMNVTFAENNYVFSVNAPSIGVNGSYVQVYEWNASLTNWEQRGNNLAGCGYYLSSATTMALGGAMSNRIAIANASDNSIAGVCRFYYYNSITDMFDPDASFTNIVGDNPLDQSGYAIGAVNAGTGGFAVGAPGNSTNGTNAGQVKIYDFCYPQYASISTTVSACSYVSPSGNHTYTSSGVYLDTLVNLHGCDSILEINLTLLQPGSTATISSCLSYTVPSGNQTYFSNGTYTDTVAAAQGCDSIITIHLTILYDSVDVSLYNNGTELAVIEPASAYQWLSCPSFTPIVGAVNQIFSPPSAGNYAVIITGISGCADTSDCTFINVGVEDMHNNLLRLYPNPSNDYIFVDGLQSFAHVQLMDALGRVVIDIPFYFQNNPIDLSKLSTGTYFIHLSCLEKNYNQIIIKN